MADDDEEDDEDEVEDVLTAKLYPSVDFRRVTIFVIIVLAG